MFPNLRRSAALAASVTVAALVAVVPAPANAADSTVTWRPGSTPDGAGFWSSACDDPGLHTSLADDGAGFERGATLTPDANGGVAWTLHPSVSTQGGPAVFADVAVAGVSVEVSGPTKGRFFAYYSDSKGTYYGTSNVDDSTTGWHVLDATDGMTWYQKSSLLGWVKQYHGLSATWTLQQFAKSNNVSDGNFLVGYELGCSAGPVAIDHLKVTTDSGTTDYDFTNRTSTTTMMLDRSSIAGNGSVLLTGEVTDSSGADVTDGAIAVMAKPYGATSFTQVGATIDPGDSIGVTPTTRTSYRLDYLGGTAASASSSATATISVTPRITMTSNKTVDHVGRVVKLRGTTAPGRAGVAVTIQRKQGSTWAKVAKAVTDDTGAYAAKITPTSGGTWKLRARLSSSAGNTSATSNTRTISVQIPTRIRAKVRPGKVVVGKRYSVVGTTTRAKKGTRVRLQMRVGSQWATVARTRVTRTGKFRFRPKSTVVGRFVLRTVLSASGVHLGSHSGRVRLRVTAPPSEPAPTPTPTPTPTTHHNPPSTGVGHG